MKNCMNSAIIQNIQKKRPKIHSITNTITINDCANIILAAGGSATMASAPEEAAEMTALCDGLVLNLGAVSSLDAMLSAGKKANELRHPVVLDPVAAGATSLRRFACQTLLNELNFSAIRGNAAEIAALASHTASFVDAEEFQVLQEKNLNNSLENARLLSQNTGAAIVVSGIDDLVVYGEKHCVIHGGSPLSARITGSGCMLTELICTCLAALPDSTEYARFDAVCTAVSWMNDAAEKAARKTRTADGGTMSFRMYLIDEISKTYKCSTRSLIS